MSDFYFIEADEPEAIQDLIVRLVKERIPARFGFDPKTDIQVLTPINRSVLGARNLNQVLQTALNPGDGGPEIQRFGWTLRLGDRVIQTENDYNRDVFNGDLGVIESINRIEQEMVVNFEGRQVEYDFGDLDEIALAYVLSIDKSQGSEFPCVVIPILKVPTWRPCSMPPCSARVRLDCPANSRRGLRFSSKVLPMKRECSKKSHGRLFRRQSNVGSHRHVDSGQWTARSRKR